MKNIIETDLRKLDPVLKSFVQAEITKSNRLGISVHLINKSRVEGVSGFFDDEGKVLATATGNSKWVETFVHETCHRDQWSEKDPVFTQQIKGFERHNIIDMWLKGVVELNPKQLDSVIHGIMDLELNNEKRSAAKIKKLNLPIDVKMYIKRANAYVFFHKAMQVKRKWYKLQPWSRQAILEAMPDKFLAKKDYYNIDKKLLQLMLNGCWNK
jgi:hypothetical protein